MPSDGCPPPPKGVSGGPLGPHISQYAIPGVGSLQIRKILVSSKQRVYSRWRFCNPAIIEPYRYMREPLPFRDLAEYEKKSGDR